MNKRVIDDKYLEQINKIVDAIIVQSSLSKSNSISELNDALSTLVRS